MITYKEKSKELQPIVTEKLQSVFELCKKYSVKHLYVFGSATSSRFSINSDLDFLVTFGDIPIIDYADYFFDFMHDLEDLYNRKIDLITEKSLTNPYLINSINRNKILIYDGGNQKVSA